MLSTAQRPSACTTTREWTHVFFSPGPALCATLSVAVLEGFGPWCCSAGEYSDQSSTWDSLGASLHTHGARAHAYIKTQIAAGLSAAPLLSASACARQMNPISQRSKQIVCPSGALRIPGLFAIRLARCPHLPVQGQILITIRWSRPPQPQRISTVFHKIG